MFPDVHVLSAELTPILIGGLVVFMLIALVVLNVWLFPTWVQIQARQEGIYRKRFVCPIKGREVEVEFVTPLLDPAMLLGVARCSAFTRGEVMDCDRSCLRLPQAREVRPLFAPRFLPAPFPLI
jgi:hypothetical protein